MIKKNPNQYQRDRWVNNKLMSVKEGLKILDIASGSSPYKKFCAHLTYHSQDFCQLPDTEYGEHTFVCDVLSIPAEKKSYDAILCTEALEHFPEPIKAIKEMARLLKPGGLLILTAPLGSGIHQAPYHYYGGFTPFWYKHFLAEANFEKITCEPAAGFFFFLAQELARAEVYLRKASEVKSKFLSWLIWPLVGPFLRIILAPFFRKLDRVSEKTEFTIGYHVTAQKNNK